MHRPADVGAFHFVIVASLRAVQLSRGCVPRVDGAQGHKYAVTAQMEVAAGKIVASAPVLAGTVIRTR